MATHLFAFYKSSGATSFEEINVVKDDVLTRTSDTRFMVPVGLHNILFGVALGPNLVDAKLYTPSLETKKHVARIIPRYRGGNTLPLIGNYAYIPEPPLRLVDTEELSFLAYQDAATPPSDIIGVFAFAPDTLPAVPAGEPITVRCASSTTLTAYQWTTVKVVPEVQLEAGTYALIDFLPISANCIAARVIIPGQVWRPGVLGFAGDEKTALSHARARYLPIPKYEMGRFSHLAIPEFQFLSAAADTSEVVYMKVVKVA
ncbi:MAG: hypothetical protein QXH85_05615 [Candidatus Bathyarchaeia archaeon]